jgi:hypothetical protein
MAFDVQKGVWLSFMIDLHVLLEGLRKLSQVLLSPYCDEVVVDVGGDSDIVSNLACGI